MDLVPLKKNEVIEYRCVNCRRRFLVDTSRISGMTCECKSDTFTVSVVTLKDEDLENAKLGMNLQGGVVEVQLHNDIGDSYLTIQGGDKPETD